MAHEYDITLKELFQTVPPDLLRQLVGQEALELLTVEFPTVQMRSPDFVARLAGGEIYHLDLQSDNDDNMEWRMLQYYFLLHRLYGQAPIQQVLYVGAAAMSMNRRISHPRLQYEYDLIDVRDLRGDELLASPSIADNIFAVLCRADERESVRAVLARLARLDENTRQDLFSKLSILAKLRKLDRTLKEEAEIMPIVFNLRENAVFAPYFDEAENKGMQRGLRQGLRQGLRRQLEKRFGLMPAWAQERLEAADYATLEVWSERVLDAASLEDVLGRSVGRR